MKKITLCSVLALTALSTINVYASTKHDFNASCSNAMYLRFFKNQATVNRIVKFAEKQFRAMGVSTKRLGCQIKPQTNEFLIGQRNYAPNLKKYDDPTYTGLKRAYGFAIAFAPIYDKNGKIASFSVRQGQWDFEHKRRLTVKHFIIP